MRKKLYSLLFAFYLLLSGFYLLSNLFTFPVAAQTPEAPVTIQMSTSNNQQYVIPDTYVEFDITIQNTTDQLITNVTVLNEFDGREFEPFIADSLVISGTQRYQLTPERTLDTAGRVSLTWFLERLQPQQSLIIRYGAQVNSQEGDTVTNSAQVKVDDSQAESILILPNPAIEISQTILGNELIGSDGHVRFQLILTNTTAFPIPDLEVWHDLNGYSQLPNFQQVIPVGNSALQPANFDDFLIWTVGELAPFEKWQITYDAVIEPFFEEGNETVSSWASVYVADDYLDGTDQVKLSPEKPVLELTRESAMKVDARGNAIREEIRPGDTVQFTIHYTNKGNYQAEQVMLVDDFDETLFEEIFPGDITDSGYPDGGRIRWDLATIPAGGTGSVSYTLTLKEDLSPFGTESEGKVTAVNSAQLLVSQQSMANLSDQFTMRTPNLSLRISVNDLRVRQGDSYRVTIEVFNTGSAQAENVKIVATYDDTIGSVPTLPEDSPEEEGQIVWKDQMIPANDSMVYEYTFTVDKNAETDSVRHEARISLENSERSIKEDTVRVGILPVKTSQIEDQMIFGILISLLIVGTLLVAGYQSQKLIQKEDLKVEQYQFFRDIVEILSVILIVTAVLLLGFTGDLGDSQALTVLSGIAGYVLGRRAGGVERPPTSTQLTTAPTSEPDNGK